MELSPVLIERVRRWLGLEKPPEPPEPEPNEDETMTLLSQIADAKTRYTEATNSFLKVVYLTESQMKALAWECGQNSRTFDAVEQAVGGAVYGLAIRKLPEPELKFSPFLADDSSSGSGIAMLQPATVDELIRRDRFGCVICSGNGVRTEFWGEAAVSHPEYKRREREANQAAAEAVDKVHNGPMVSVRPDTGNKDICSVWVDPVALGISNELASAIRDAIRRMVSVGSEPEGYYFMTEEGQFVCRGGRLVRESKS